jgi:hypothetical protein
MRQPLKIALAVAVLGAAWAAMQPSDDGVELASSDRRGAPSSRGRGGDGEAGQEGPRSAGRNTAREGGRAERGPASAARAASNASSAAVPWTDAALSEGVRAWRLRRADAEALPPARPMSTSSPSAWASMAPPPPPPVKMVAPPPPPPPMAPRFPHTWIGRINDETVSAEATPSQPARAIQRAVLAGAVANWVVKEGDVIEGQWRVDRIQDRTMSLTFLPLQQSQTVSMK